MNSIEHGYLPRVADKVLARKLKSSGAVQIKGPKWCGKTATAEQAAASSIYMQDPDNARVTSSLPIRNLLFCSKETSRA